MLAILVQCDDSIDYTPGADVAAGAVVDLGMLFGVATSPILSGAAGALVTEGIFDIAKSGSTGPVFQQGDDVFWDSTNSLAVGYAAAAGFKRIGVAAAAATTSATSVRVILNEGFELPPAFRGRVWEAVTNDKTLDAEDTGKVMVVTVDAKVVTIPATVAGLDFVIANGGVDAAVGLSISPQAGDQISKRDHTGTDNKDEINTKATAKRGDYMRLVGNGGVGYFVSEMRGVWASEG